MIVLNLKTYPQATNPESLLNLSQIAQQTFNQYQIPIILCPQTTNIFLLSQKVDLPVFAQHIDPIEPGKNTGFISAASVKTSGAIGTLINHSEHRIGLENIQKTVALAKQNNLQTLVCVENSQEAGQVDQFGVDYIALEDPVLIGGDVSIVENEAGKQKVQEFVSFNLQAKALVGAGVKDQADIRESLRLGATGVLLASGFVKAENPQAVLQDLCEGFK